MFKGSHIQTQVKSRQNYLTQTSEVILGLQLMTLSEECSALDCNKATSTHTRSTLIPMHIRLKELTSSHKKRGRPLKQNNAILTYTVHSNVAVDNLVYNLAININKSCL